MTSLFHEWEARQRQDQFDRDIKRRESWNLPDGRLPRTSLFAWLKGLTGGTSAVEPTVHVASASATEAARAPVRKAG